MEVTIWEGGQQQKNLVLPLDGPAENVLGLERVHRQRVEIRAEVDFMNQFRPKNRFFITYFELWKQS
jgi:hypothetical protein